MATRFHDHGCPNCAAPVQVAVGEIQVVCEYCGSLLRFEPTAGELEVVRTREEMKRRERVEVQKAALRLRAEQREMERWRKTAATVALQAMPVIGDAAGRTLFRGAVRKGSGCGCGCLAGLAGLLLAALAVLTSL